MWELPLERADLANKLIDWGVSYSAVSCEEGFPGFWFLFTALSCHFRPEYQKLPRIWSNYMMLHKVWDRPKIFSAALSTQNHKTTSQNFIIDLSFRGPPHLHSHDISKAYLNFQSIILMISMHGNEKHIFSRFQLKKKKKSLHKKRW